MVIIITILVRMGYDVEEIKILLLDNDSVFNNVDLKEGFEQEFAIYAECMFKFILNFEKSTIAKTPNDIEFLGYRNESSTPMRTREDLLMIFSF